MRYTVETPKIREAWAQQETRIAQAVTAAMTEATAGAQADLRGQVVAAGLGQRLANTWRSKVYPAGKASLDPSGYLWSKAPKLVDAFDRGATIVPANGQFYLAIPTANVPRKGRKRMTPLDVETAFNQDLILRRAPNGHILAFVDVAFARYSKSQGAAYGKRKQVRAGKPKLVLMFTLVRQVTLRKRTDIRGVAKDWAGKVPELVTDNLR